MFWNHVRIPIGHKCKQDLTYGHIGEVLKEERTAMQQLEVKHVGQKFESSEAGEYLACWSNNEEVSVARTLR